MTDKPKKVKALRGATKPRLHSPLLKGSNKLQDVKDLCDIVKIPLLPWQEFVLKDILTVDKKGMWIRKTNLILSQTEWKDPLSAYADTGAPD